MARRTLSRDWSIVLDDAFERKSEDGEIVFWAEGRTVYASIFETGNADAEEAIEKMMGERLGTPTRTFDRIEPGLAAHAYLLPEGEGDDRYWGLNTWTAAGGSVACLTFYFESMDGLPWALAAWHSVENGTGAKKYFN